MTVVSYSSILDCPHEMEEITLRILVSEDSLIRL